ncbi:hypothetical protein NFI96_012089 [Prochilodus magdalenae]|nr:hypothetical protein NFI96_012089 [Prochilodus magdalenae]
MGSGPASDRAGRAVCRTSDHAGLTVVPHQTAPYGQWSRIRPRKGYASDRAGRAVVPTSDHAGRAVVPHQTTQDGQWSRIRPRRMGSSSNIRPRRIDSSSASDRAGWAVVPHQTTQDGQWSRIRPRRMGSSSNIRPRRIDSSSASDRAGWAVVPHQTTQDGQSPPALFTPVYGDPPPPPPVLSHPSNGVPLDWDSNPSNGVPLDWDSDPSNGVPLDWDSDPSNGVPLDWDSDPSNGVPLDWDSDPINGVPLDWDSDPINGVPLEWDSDPSLPHGVIPPWQPRRPHGHHRKRNTSNLIYAPRSSPTLTRVVGGLWNCQSAVQKADFISALASHHSLHFLALTETWITHENSSTPAALSSAFNFSHSPRQTGRGGGTGLLLSRKWNFIDELDTLLSLFPVDGSPLLLLGDFNLPSDKLQSSCLQPLLSSFDPQPIPSSAPRWQHSGPGLQ